jgi:hypothetical protein
VRFSRCSLASRRALISAISSISLSGSCSSAASAQSSSQRSLFSSMTLCIARLKRLFSFCQTESGSVHIKNCALPRHRNLASAQSAAIKRRSRCGLVRGWPVQRAHFSPGAAPQVVQGTVRDWFWSESFFLIARTIVPKQDSSEWSILNSYRRGYRSCRFQIRTLPAVPWSWS